MKNASIVIISILVILLAIASFENMSLYDDIDGLKAEIDHYDLLLDAEYERGYKDGVNENSFSASSTYGAYYEIESMSREEILEYLDDGFYGKPWEAEDAHNLAIFAFQKGYSNCRSGVWDEMTEWFITGYEFTPTEAKQFSNFLW